MRAAAAMLASAFLLAGCGSGSSSSAGKTARTTATGGSTMGGAASATSSAAASTTTVPRPPGVPPGRPLAGGLRLSSPSLGPGGAIPSAYTCDGRDTSLPLRWTGIPTGSRELVLVLRDPDASAPDFVHWAVAGIPAVAGGFPAGAVTGHVIPGRNSFGSLGYRGPCPPQGSRAHHYVLSLIALSAPSGLSAGFSADQLRTQALAIATLVGTYARR